MKKLVLTLSLLATIVCSILAFASPTAINSGEKMVLPKSMQQFQRPSKEAVAKMLKSRKAIPLRGFVDHSTTGADSTVVAPSQTVDIWANTHHIYEFNSQTIHFLDATDSISFNSSESLFTGVTDINAGPVDFMWLSEAKGSYTFSATLTADGNDLLGIYFVQMNTSTGGMELMDGAELDFDSSSARSVRFTINCNSFTPSSVIGIYIFPFCTGSGLTSLALSNCSFTMVPEGGVLPDPEPTPEPEPDPVPDPVPATWTTVSVANPGEFASTFLAQNNEVWTGVSWLKVTGELNSTDLNNLRNIETLSKLDLSEAELTEVPNNCLYSHTYISEVTLPQSVTRIGHSAFSQCPLLTTVTAPGVKTIGDASFQACFNLTDFNIATADSIGTSAFSGCSKYNTPLPEGLKAMGSYAFTRSGIQKAVIPAGLSEVAEGAFVDCKNLTEVETSSSTRDIKRYAFQSCPKLAKVTLAEGLASIYAYAFSGCSALTEISLPKGLSLLGAEAFAYCSQLAEIHIPSTITSFGKSMMKECPQMKRIYCRAANPPSAIDMFLTGAPLEQVTVYVYPFSTAAYRAANYWNNFYNYDIIAEPISQLDVKDPLSIELRDEYAVILSQKPNINLTYQYLADSNAYTVGELTTFGATPLSMSTFRVGNYLDSRDYNSLRPTLINQTEGMRADRVLTYLKFYSGIWHFISLPYDVNMSDIWANQGTDFVIRSYNGERRANGDGTLSNWENVPSDGVLTANRGYIVMAVNNLYNTQPALNFPSHNSLNKNQIFSSKSVEVGMEEYPSEFSHNRSWNLVGNPFPAYFNMHCLQEGFTTPITLWRGTSYQAYSPVDDNIILAPNEAFFIQKPLNFNTLVFAPEGRLHYNAAHEVVGTPGAKAPARGKAGSLRSIFNFNLTGAASTDRARVVINDEVELAYETDRDASKFFSDTPAGAEIYVAQGNVKFAICERPEDNGLATLGIKVAAEGEYTIDLEGRNTQGWSVVLTDNLTGTETDLTRQSYTFTAKRGEAEGRFTVRLKAPQSSAIEDVEAGEFTPDSVVTVSNAAGVIIFEGRLSEFTAPAPGIYIVAANGTARKMVIK